MPDASGQEAEFTQPQRRQADNIVQLNTHEVQGPAEASLTDLLIQSRGKNSEEKKTPEQIIEEKDAQIANLQQQVEYLAESSRIDKQTGLYNKNAYLDDIYPALIQAFRSGKKVGLISMDLQGVKLINDRDGHEAGDALIAKYGEAIKFVMTQRKRETDKGYRVGGDEAVVLLFDVDEKGVEKAAQDFKSMFDRQGINTGIGAGIIDTSNWDGMIDSMGQIDKRLYDSKREANTTGENNIKLNEAA